MRAISPDMQRATPIRQDQGRPLPHVRQSAQRQKDFTIMHDVPDIRIPAPRQPEPAHQAWCVNHINDDQGPGTCMSADIVLPGQIVALTYQPGDGVQVNVCTGNHMEVVPVAEARQRAAALAAIVAVAEAHEAVTA